ncbi:hypothetical protein EYC80_007650 [Monilinia laxa]|uniref:Uncharacterized protein n=1 Tax=Monilinia laxa TaxID=61186 RepID=A0A5N6JWL0_MONLA|nr:hypothetical protein EYC80_007650 [Monilinia laxa]
MDTSTLITLYTQRYSCNNNVPHPATLTLEERADITPAILGLPQPHKFIHLHFQYSKSNASKKILMHLYLEYQTHDWFKQEHIDKLNLFRIAAFTMHYDFDISDATGNLGATRYVEEHEKRLWFPNLPEFASGENRQDHSDPAGAQGETWSRDVARQAEIERQQVQDDLRMATLRELYRTQVPDHSFSTRIPGIYGHPSLALASTGALSTDAVATGDGSTGAVSAAPVLPATGLYYFAPYDPTMTLVRPFPQAGEYSELESHGTDTHPRKMIIADDWFSTSWFTLFFNKLFKGHDIGTVLTRLFVLSILVSGFSTSSRRYLGTAFCY